MHHAIKYISHLVLTVSISANLTSCGRIETPREDEQYKIEFSNVSTKAMLDDIDDMTEFGVFAEYGDNDKDKWSPLLTAEMVYRDGDDFIYDNVQYWIKDQTFRFFAVWPYGTEVDTDNAGIYEVSYTTPDTADDDLLTAYCVGTYPDDFEDGTVPLDFNHILSKFRLQISYDGVKNQFDNFWIKSVSLANVKQTGVLTTSVYNKTESWYFNEDRLTFTKEYDAPGAQLELSAGSLMPWESLTLIPQSFNRNDIALTIVYDYQQNGVVDNESPIIEKTVMTTLPAGEWKAGKVYTYNITISESNLVVFKNIGVQEWGAPISGGAIIIK